MPSIRTTVLALTTAMATSCLLPAAPSHAEEQGPVVFREEGQASFYADKFQGKKTASGEPFDQKELTAAHPTLPLGSEVTVKNVETGKEVTVEITDRGPYAKDREIDLSRAAAKEIGVTKKEGVAEVEIEATKEQVVKAIEEPEDAKKVVKQLKEARQIAAEDGTPQPKPLPPIVPPAEAAAKDGDKGEKKEQQAAR